MSLNNTEKLTMDMVTNSLLNEEVRRQSHVATSGSQALVSEERTTRGRSKTNESFKKNKSRGRSKSKKGLKCYYCNKLGHIKKDCWKLKKELKGKNVDNKTEDDKNVNVMHDDLLIIFDCGNDCLTTNYDTSWVVDSGASFHATPNQNFFTTS